MKKLLKTKVLLFGIAAVSIITIIFLVVIVICGYEIGEAIVDDEVNEMRSSSSVINSQLYAEKYRSLLNKHLITSGYVTLERMVFYLQRINNVLDVSTLSNDEWEKAYFANLNEEKKQMIPIKTICINIKNDESLPIFDIKNGKNADGYAIDVIDLCHVNGKDVATSDNYSENYHSLIYDFPIKSNFTITSIVFEHRNIDFGFSEEEQKKVNFHSGWDFAVPIGTNFYSICDGIVESIVNTQDNDLPYKESENRTGNYIVVGCDNSFVAQYLHIKYMSVPSEISIGSRVDKGALLGQTSTTGQSTGPHLHLGLKDQNGNSLDAVQYMDFIKEEIDEETDD